nr:5-formyltetrahydrofolate cyclo-ligase [Litchfieldia salsa]
MVTKQELRKKMREQLKSINRETYEKWSSEIARNVTLTNDWKIANTIGITISGDLEVDTLGLIEKAWSEGKTVCTPKCEHTTKEMNFRKITDYNQLEIVYFSLREPIIERTTPIPHDEIDLLFVPGLAFTKSGYRLGQGGGYYDRYLMNYKGKTTSLAFELSLIEELPIEHFDIPVQKLITNKQVLSCKG